MYTQILHQIQQSMAPFASDGAVSNSIPELALIDPSKFGIHLVTTHGIDYGIGDSNERFSIQSISKVLALSHAFTFVGENIWNRVGVEPSGNPFNSLGTIRGIRKDGKTETPFINAGALWLPIFLA